MSTPAEELHAAATRLRETAAEATGGPWENGEDDHLWIGGSVWGYSVRKKGEFLDGDPAWIALANPALAEPLAAWLEYRAECVDAMVNGVNKIPTRLAAATPENRFALDIARVINGGGAS